MFLKSFFFHNRNFNVDSEISQKLDRHTLRLKLISAKIYPNKKFRKVQKIVNILLDKKRYKQEIQTETG